MSWKANAVIFHDPLAKEFAIGDAVPDSVVKISPWLLEEGLVVDSKSKVAQPAAQAPAEDAQASLHDGEHTEDTIAASVAAEEA